MTHKIKYFLAFVFFFSPFLLLKTYGQTVFQHISDEAVYEFLDELASEQIIEINSAIKPYSRSFISQNLKKALSSDKLSRRQAKEAQKFLIEYDTDHGFTEGKRNLYQDDNTVLSWLPPNFRYKDSVSRVTVRPVYGIRYFTNENNSFYHSYGGAEMWSELGENWNIYASLRDNYQQKEILALPDNLTLEQGGAYKINVQDREGGDYSEMRGGITYAGKWGHVGIIKDHIEWGTNVNGANIFSGRTPSFAMIKLQLKPFKWLQFDYHHGWLVSQVTDSLRSYYTSNGDFRAVYREKYIAANMYTIKPFPSFYFSFGNSIVYSDIDFQPAYLIPFFFFKSIDHTINRGIENQNSQMFFNIDSKNLKHTHLYLSVFVDEFSITRVNDPERHNFFSYKAGLGLSNWPVKNVGIKAEFTRTSPVTYKHRVPSTTFASNQYNLGHYLTDNSSEIYAEIWTKPHHNWKAKLSYVYSKHGRDHDYVFGDTPVDEFSFLENKSWDQTRLNASLTWSPHAVFSMFMKFQYSDIQGYALDGNTAEYYINKFTPDYLHGETSTFIMGFRFSR
ncbi:MAG: hypothetical protein ACQESJ_09110 [Bacteroidota bacterium]